LSWVPLPAPRDPLLRGPEVAHEAEEDVAHGGAVGDGDRERVVAEAALGVERAVDRVDDDGDRRIAVVDDPALLGEDREARALRVQGVHLREHGTLGGGVDLQRAVAALPALAGLHDALGDRGVVGEHLADRAGRPAGGPEPIRGHRSGVS